MILGDSPNRSAFIALKKFYKLKQEGCVSNFIC